jgi:hypothetical protein
MIEKEFILYTVRSATKKQSYYNRAILVGAWVRLTIEKAEPVDYAFLSSLQRKRIYQKHRCVNCFLVCLWGKIVELDEDRYS